ncbi:MAG: permease [Candidatus Hydromicrobium sp.]
MEKLITLFPEILTGAVMAVITAFAHNWIPLSLAILIAAILKAHVDMEKLKTALLRKSNVSILASVAVGAFTPFCACGTMVVVIGMLTTTLPWGAVMAFLTSSPLMSPGGFIMLAGIISLKFAIALTIASIIIGLGSGYLTHLIEKKTDFLKNQTRFSEKPKAQTCCDWSGSAFIHEPQVQTCGCSDPAPIPKQGCCDAQIYCAVSAGNDISQSTYTSDFGQVTTKNTGINIFLGFLKRIKWRAIAEALINVGVKQILLFYSIFVAVGFLINYFVPTSLIVNLFSAKNVFAVPLAALIGLPIYVSLESSIPLIKALMAGGAGGGAMLAFMITGPGTSAWVIAGIATFMKKRVLGLYILFILGWGILLGYLYELLLAMGI